MNNTYIIFGILVASLATYATRKLPFLIFDKKKPSPLIIHIETYMPQMIMVILIFYAIRNVEFGEYPYGISEIVGIIVAGAIHLKFRNSLLSIVIATTLYMFLVQKIF